MEQTAQDHELKPWDLQPDETTKTFNAFTVYRDLGPQERSLTATASTLNVERSQCGRWSSQFEWVRRAAAWDKEQDRQN
jgi:hypothetical protein